MKEYLCFLLLLTNIAVCSVFGDEEFIPGFISLGEERHDGMLYYILFKSRDKNPTAPLIWYFEGGPGQSSMHGLFFQNGPFRLRKDHTLVRNEYSLNNMADVLYVDQPLGTGFSNCSDTTWVPHTEEVILADLYKFTVSFFEIHPEYKGRPVFLLSQGYGSHFILPLATIYIKGLIQGGNLQGIALGNPWIRPELQITSRATYSKKILNCGEFKYIAAMYGYVISSIFIDLDFDEAAIDIIRIATGVLVGAHHHPFNPEDIRIRCPTGPCFYNFSELNTFLDQSNVRHEMETVDRTFNYTSSEVFRWLVYFNEYLSDKSDSLIYILDHSNVPVFIFSGMMDWTINTEGLDEVIASLHWTGRHRMNNLTWKAWYSDGQLQGRYKHYKGLYYIHVTDAGHYVGMDVPSFTLDAMMRLIYGSDH